MMGLTESLWPIRYKPYRDELLTSWLIRLAWGHGLKVQTFCNLVFGAKHQVWNRDVDRLAPAWLLEKLTDATGTPADVALQTTLRPFEGIIYSKFKESGALPWIQTLMVYHRKRNAYGMQFCPKCLSEDKEPYFRRSWRIAFNTICTHHQVMLHDRCPQCAAPVMYHRIEMGHAGIPQADSMGDCHACGYALANSPAAPVKYYEPTAAELHYRLCAAITERDGRGIALEEMQVMHQLVRLMLSRYPSVALRGHVCVQLGVLDLIVGHGRMSLESMPLPERHHLMQLVAWVLVDLEVRLIAAWRAGVIRYNHMEKDFNNAPFWYRCVTAKCRNWRNR